MSIQDWIIAEKEDIHDILTAKLRGLQDQDRLKREGMFRRIRLYGNIDMAGVDFNSGSMSTISSVLLQDRLKINVCQSAVDTIVSKGSKNEPKPRFITSGGDWANRNKAKLLEKLVWSNFLDLGIYNTMRKILRDACVFGTGVLKICRDEDGIIAERVFPWEVFVDTLDAIYGSPHNIFQTKTVSRSVLIAEYPELEDAIWQAANIDSGLTERTVGSPSEEAVEVIEAWGLKNGKLDGRHVITLTNQVLVDEEYKSPKLPFIFYKWIDPVVNFWGTGVIEQLEAIQVEINKTLFRIQRSLELLGVPWVLIEKNSEIVKDSMSNRIGQVIRYSKTPPKVETHKSINNETLVYLNMLLQKAYEQAGISRQSAVSIKDPGVTAGVAMREQQNIESERFMKSMKDYEDAFLDIAFHIIEAVKAIAEDEGSYVIKIHGDKVVEEITWEDINLDDHQYKIQIFPVSSLPTRPESKLQVVQEYLSAGFIDQNTARDLFNFPDLDAEEELHLSPRHIIEKNVDKMLVDGEYQSIDPLDDLNYAIKYATNAYHLARINDVDEENLAVLRGYIDEVLSLIREGQQPAEPVPQQLPAGPAPLGVPAPQPISELLPVIPKGKKEITT